MIAQAMHKYKASEQPISVERLSSQEKKSMRRRSMTRISLIRVNTSGYGDLGSGGSNGAIEEESSPEKDDSVHKKE